MDYFVIAGRDMKPKLRDDFRVAFEHRPGLLANAFDVVEVSGARASRNARRIFAAGWTQVYVIHAYLQIR